MASRRFLSGHKSTSCTGKETDTLFSSASKSCARAGAVKETHRQSRHRGRVRGAISAQGPAFRVCRGRQQTHPKNTDNPVFSHGQNIHVGISRRETYKCLACGDAWEMQIKIAGRCPAHTRQRAQIHRPTVPAVGKMSGSRNSTFC